MHVGGLQLYKVPPDAGRNYGRELYESLRETHLPADVAPLFLKHPQRSARTAGAWVWVEDDEFDIDYHLRHSALPKPGRIRELLELVSRLHSSRMATERPLWEWHLIEGLSGRRIAMYAKVHHSLIDGIGASRLLQSALSTDPDLRGMPAPWVRREVEAPAPVDPVDPESISTAALRQAIGITTEAVGLPGALIETLRRSLRNEASSLALYAPRTILNQPITGSRRFAAQDWPLERLARNQQGVRHHGERRRVGHVQRRDAEIPDRARTSCRRRHWWRWSLSRCVEAKRARAASGRTAAMRSARSWSS